MKNIRKIKEILDSAEAILITAGAGMGVDSGLPDFRGNDGFWREYPVVKKLGLEFAQMANPKWFVDDAYLAWAFYGHRLNLYRVTTPHRGFGLLLDYVKSKNSNYFVFTSNVDGQFSKSGFDSDKIVEIHGSIHHLQCSQKCTSLIWENSESIEVDMDKFRAKKLIYCPNCSYVARPNILMFGDFGWVSDRTSLQEDRYEKWLNKNSHKKIAIIEIGAGSAIPTVRMEGEYIAKEYDNATLIRINPREYSVDNSLGYSLECGGLEAIEQILE
jgi:NAD-dependent SIR2 family protein deacetylase